MSVAVLTSTSNGCIAPDSASGGGGAASTSSGGGGACPNDLPESCPSPEPLYTSEVAAVIKSRCLTCHTAGGQAATTPLGDYADVYARRTTVLTRVYACKMPPPDAPQLTEEERTTLLGWLVCGAEDN
ncbi:MAG: hypothetical protein U0441_26000 [Polyangiaceae bacterium]